jgi:hypothetical protein
LTEVGAAVGPLEGTAEAGGSALGESTAAEPLAVGNADAGGGVTIPVVLFGPPAAAAVVVAGGRGRGGGRGGSGECRKRKADAASTGPASTMIALRGGGASFQPALARSTSCLSWSMGFLPAPAAPGAGVAGEVMPGAGSAPGGMPCPVMP